MKNTQYKPNTPVKPTLRPTAQDLATTAVALVDLTKLSLGNPVAVLTTLAMAYRIFELDAVAGRMDEKAMEEGTALGMRMADSYHKVQEGIRAKAASLKTGLVGLDGKFMSTTDQQADNNTNQAET